MAICLMYLIFIIIPNFNLCLKNISIRYGIMIFIKYFFTLTTLIVKIRNLICYF